MLLGLVWLLPTKNEYMRRAFTLRTALGAEDDQFRSKCPLLESNL